MYPLAALYNPVVFANKALLPTAVLPSPVLLYKALSPTATKLLVVVFLYSALIPTATLLLPVVASLTVALTATAAEPLVGFGERSTPLTTGPAIDAVYGQSGTAAVDGVSMRWYAFAHPGNRAAYWAALHTGWLARVQR